MNNKMSIALGSLAFAFIVACSGNSVPTAVFESTSSPNPVAARNVNSPPQTPRSKTLEAEIEATEIPIQTSIPEATIAAISTQQLPSTTTDIYPLALTPEIKIYLDPLLKPNIPNLPEKSYERGKIAFVSDRDGNREIYIMNSDGSDLKNLTNNPANDFGPKWSPDGKKIAFVSDRGGNEDIYVMNVDGSGQTNLTNNPGNYGFPNWSPDGEKIVFVSERDEQGIRPATQAGDGYGNDEIYVMNADGSGLKRLTNYRYIDYAPNWSPDGERIVFTSYRHRACPQDILSRDCTVDFPWRDEIFVMNADGSGLINLTNSISDDEQPKWSPDGKKIAFVSDREGDGDIYVMNADGSGQKNLTNNPLSYNAAFFWSPDGKSIAFTSQRDGNDEIYVMNADGSNQKRLTNNPNNDAFPRWSPNGKKIAYYSVTDKNFDIFIMNADGSGQTNLTINSARDRPLNWSPLLPVK